MASRFEQNKPDPAIKKNVLQARSRQRGGKYTRAMVAGASVAVTIMSWALFSTLDPNTLPQTQTAQTTQYITTTSTIDTAASTSAAAPATPVTSAQVVGSMVSAITSTRSSR